MRGLRTSTGFLGAACLAIVLMGGALAQDTTQDGAGSDGLVAALSYVPDTPQVRQDLVSWLDQDALIETRHGAAKPTSGADLAALLASDEPSAELLRAALMGASSGDPEFLQRLASASRWPAELGFDITDFGAHAHFGTPPSDGTVLLGAFDPAAIEEAFAQRDYAAEVVDSHTLLCGSAGCEHGFDVDLASADPGLPFGSELGRREPLAVSRTDILSSADVATVRAMLDASQGSALSLADDPSYRAVATAASPEARLIQATILQGGMVGLDPTIFAFFAESPEAAGELVVRLDEAFEEMPSADAIAILDAATATEQVVSVALAYADPTDAASAAAILPRRLEDLPSLSTGEPLADLLAERGVTSIDGRVVPGSEDLSSAAVLELRAPLPDDVEGDGGPPPPSSQLYRSLIDLVMRRDVLWLAPVLPLE